MNHVDEISKYYKIWRKEFAADKLFKYSYPETVLRVIDTGGWDPRKSSYRRICATDKIIIPTFSYNTTTRIALSNEVFYYINYLNCWKELLALGYWTSPDGKEFTDTTLLPWESEFYATKFVPLDYIDEIIILIKADEQTEEEKVITLIQKCRDRGIKIKVDRLEVSDALAIACACDVFEWAFNFYTYYRNLYELISVHDYLPRILNYVSPFYLDFAWLVDTEHGVYHPEPNYEYDKLFIDKMNELVNTYGYYYVERTNLVVERHFKTEVKAKILQERTLKYFAEFWEIYFGMKPKWR